VRLKSWEGGVGATAEDLLQKIQTLLTAIFRLSDNSLTTNRLICLPGGVSFERALGGRIHFPAVLNS
jgi:hypothetical protein